VTAAARPLRLGLIGSPNSGKTTLFNALTGLRARVGNYPGVTVERREATVELDDRSAIVIDLPGTYSLDPISPDEAVVQRVLDGEIDEVPPPDALIMVADACSLERSLLLVGDVIRRGLPTCLVLTMVDELQARSGALDLARLEAALGIPVVAVVGHRGLGVDRLRSLLGASESWSRPPILPPEDRLERAGWADSIVSAVVTTRPTHHRATEAIDRVVLHPIAGTLLFGAVMVAFFQLIFAWATPAMDWIDSAIGVIAAAVHRGLGAGMLSDFLANGVVAGVGAVVIFLPQIVLLFSLLYVLEDVGYMARAAFVVDRAMGRIGLEGRAFVALLSSYACAVPGIMATRTIPSPRDRLVTILVAPLMTCSARLPVYALLIGAFVPERNVWGPIGLQGLVLLGLYGLGAGAAIVAAAVLGRLLLPSEGLPFTMELPSYRWPTLRLLASQVWGSASAFLRRAGTIILVRLRLPAPRRHDHPRDVDRVVVPAELPTDRAAERSRAGRSRELPARTQRRRAARTRDRASDRATRLRLEDRRRPRCEPRRTRGDRRDTRPDLRRFRRGELTANRRAQRHLPRHGRARLRRRHGRIATRLLRLCAPVHVDTRDDAPRDELMALARLRVQLSAGARIRG